MKTDVGVVAPASVFFLFEISEVFPESSTASHLFAEYKKTRL